MSFDIFAPRCYTRLPCLLLRFCHFKATSHKCSLHWRICESVPEARLKSICQPLPYKRRGSQITVKSAVLILGVPFEKSTLKKLEHILSCKSSGPCPNQETMAQTYWPACQNFGVPYPKRMSCKCASSHERQFVGPFG